MNLTAIIRLKGLSFNDPRIIVNRGGEQNVCNPPFCEKISYAGGILEFNVTEWSAYFSEETPVVQQPTGGGGGSGHYQKPIEVIIQNVTKCSDLLQDFKCTEGTPTCQYETDYSPYCKIEPKPLIETIVESQPIGLQEPEVKEEAVVVTPQKEIIEPKDNTKLIIILVITAALGTMGVGYLVWKANKP